MSKLIIDVSYHNGVINWEKVKASACAGAILRCGYGDDIASQDDKQWKRNANECTRLGIPFGVYIYSYAKTTAQAESEARHVLRLVKGYKLSYPVFYDLEESGTQTGAVDRMKKFAALIEAAGYKCGVYCNKSWWDNYLSSLGTRYPLWIARYNSTLGMKADMWQYSSDGSVPGISGRVDVNYCYRDFPAEITGISKPSQPASAPQPTEKKDLGQVDITYQAYTDRWWPPVTNKSDWAGKGDNVPIKWLAVKVSKGSIRCRVYTRKNGWLPYLTFGSSYDLNDKQNGILGVGSEILAVELYYITPDGYKYKMVHYRVSVQNNKNFYADQVDTLKASGMDGFAGDKYRFIDKFQAWIE